MEVCYFQNWLTIWSTLYATFCFYITTNGLTLLVILLGNLQQNNKRFPNALFTFMQPTTLFTRFKLQKSWLDIFIVCFLALFEDLWPLFFCTVVFILNLNKTCLYYIQFSFRLFLIRLFRIKPYIPLLHRCVLLVENTWKCQGVASSLKASERPWSPEG